MFDCYRKYLLVKHSADCGVDDGMDYSSKKAAQHGASQYIRDGWTTVICINTKVPRVEFVRGERIDVLQIFTKKAAAILAANTDPFLLEA